MEQMNCQVCGKLIPYGEMHITHPKLVQYQDPEKIDFEVWCKQCHRSFYELFNEWKVQRAMMRK